MYLHRPERLSANQHCANQVKIPLFNNHERIGQFIITKKIAIRSSAVAKRIGTLTPFETYGAMGAASSFYSAGWLRGDGLDAWCGDANTRDYVVFSYGTPIAWHTPENGWVVVHRAFSATSSKHQSAAKWGVSLSDDSRVEYVMIDYRLSPAQYYLLSETRITRMELTGQMKRTAAVLAAKGLVTYLEDDLIGITDTGRKVFA